MEKEVVEYEGDCLHCMILKIAGESRDAVEYRGYVMDVVQALAQMLKEEEDATVDAVLRDVKKVWESVKDEAQDSVFEGIDMKKVN